MTLMQMIMILYLGQWHDSDKKRIMEEYSTAAVAIWKWVNSATWRWCRDGDNFFEILNHHLQLSTAGTFTLPIKFLTDSFWNENIIVKIYHCHCIALGKLLFDQFSNVYDVWDMYMDCCLRDQVWVQSLPLSHDDCCQLSHDRQPSTCISLSSPLTVLAWVSIVTTLVSRGVRCDGSKYAELLWGLEIGVTLEQWE